MLKRLYLKRFFGALLLAAALLLLLDLQPLRRALRAPAPQPAGLAPLILLPAACAPDQAPTLDLNRASEKELSALPGIGPALAGRIVDYRLRCGAFQEVEELLAVEGIGPGILERIRPYLFV